jgi:hypothetical protein
MRRAICANARCFSFAATVGECVAMHHTNGFHSLCARQYCDTPDVDGPKNQRGAECIRRLAQDFAVPRVRILF